MKRMTFLFFCILSGCIKDQDYNFSNIYNSELNSITFSFSADSLAADGNSTAVINITILAKDSNDSLNSGLLNLNVSTSYGIFLDNSQASINVVPTYKLDSTGSKRILTAQITLQSSVKSDTAKLKFKYLGVEKDTAIYFYKVYPEKIKLTASSLFISPDFKTEDTIFAHQSRMTGIPTLGNPVQVSAFDSGYQRKLGTFRIINNKSNSVGNAYFVYVLGDSALNFTNYFGTVNIIGSAPTNTSPVFDTLKIYSR